MLQLLCNGSAQLRVVKGFKECKKSLCRTLRQGADHEDKETGGEEEEFKRNK